MRMRNAILILIGLLLALSSSAKAVRVADITRLGGQRTNVLTGLGLVYGLKGTGDGGDFTAAIRPLASMLKNLQDPVTITELSKVQNVAGGSITAGVPGTRAREGD